MRTYNHPFYETQADEIAALQREVEGLRDKLAATEAAYETACTAAAQKDAEIEAIKARLKRTIEVANHAEMLLAKRNTALNKATTRANLAEKEIFRLKAKLYDLLTEQDGG